MNPHVKNTLWVGIDGNEANVSKRVGSNVYAFELLSALYRTLEKEQRFSVRVFLANDPQPDLPPETSWWQYTIVTNAPLWTLWKLPGALWSYPEIDLFFSPGHYGPAWSSVPKVVSVMDVAYELFPDQFKKKDRWQLSLLTAWSVKTAHHVVAISESTKKDVVQVYRRQPEDISIIYPAAEKVPRIPKQALEEWKQVHNVTQPYILYVGTLQPRKNIIRLVKAFEHLKDHGFPGELVLAGKLGWLSQSIADTIAQSSHTASIRQLGFISDEEKAHWLQGASVLALAGLYEGFGIPALEAIQSGVIPVVSHVSSLPEVVGPKGILVDPYDSDSIAQGLQQVLSFTPAEYKSKLEQLQKFADQFDWEKSGQQLNQLLWELLTHARVL